jgi:hypothetical protein
LRERKGIPLFPFLTVTVAILVLESYIAEPKLSAYYHGQEKAGYTENLCGNGDSEKDVVFCGYSSGPEPASFRSQCAPCHFKHKDMTGPALQGVVYRSPSAEWFDGFVTNEDSLIAIEEPYTLAINKKWKIKYDHNFKLTQAELQALKNWVN